MAKDARSMKKMQLFLNGLKSRYFLIFLSIVFLLIGSVLRISRLSQKFYWIDEVSSSFVITGHWPEYLAEEFSKFSGKIVQISQVIEIFEHKPYINSEYLISSLLERDPQHSPIYFVLAGIWAHIFGAAPGILRLLASILGILTLPALIWFCWELFQSLLPCLIGLLIMVGAPFHILFCQQNREYSLWFTITLLSSAMLLAANRKNHWALWTGYAISVALGLYTFLFFLPFLLSHFFFQLSESRKKMNSRAKYFGFSFAAGILAFLPWITNMAFKAQKVRELNHWSEKSVDPLIYVQGVILGFSRLFVDFNLPSFHHLPWDRPAVIIPILTVFAIILMSLIFTSWWLSGSRRILFISVFAIPLTFLFFMDAVGGGIHGLVGRHLIPSWIAVYVAVAFTISTGFQSASWDLIAIKLSPLKLKS